MLILTRRPTETVMIGDDITITVLEVRGNQVKLAFEAPRDVTIHRSEIYARVLKERKQEKLTSAIKEEVWGKPV